MYKHHIIPFHEWKKRINPKCSRTSREFNAPDNVAWLTLEQHIQAHEYLFELNGSKLDYIAAETMRGQIGKEEAIKLAGLAVNVGKKRSPEWKKHRSELMKGNKINVGRKIPEKQKQQHSEFMRGKKMALGNGRRQKEHAKMVEEFMAKDILATAAAEATADGE
jgi:hypothetical protein